MSQIKIEIAVRQPSSFVDSEFLKSAIDRVLTEEGITTATISLAIVNDEEIHRVNREFLGHDYPTDVISFLLNEFAGGHDESGGENVTQVVESGSSPRADSANSLNFLDEIDAAAESHRYGHDDMEGELIVSAETAAREAHVHGWSPRAELLLYVVHGLLHLCGYDDLTDEARPVMRSRERELLGLWGFCPTGLEM